jgi:hypothetical protein
MKLKYVMESKMQSLTKTVRFLSLISLGATLVIIQSSAVLANCVGNPEERIIQIKVNSCDNIVAEKNADVQQNAANLYDHKTLSKFYTGALVNADLLAIGRKNSGLTNVKTVNYIFMYPSAAKNPCKQLHKNTVIKKKYAGVCCDAGKTGKCIFGGKFMWDLNSKPIDVFQ